jgi:hypothetical protein
VKVLLWEWRFPVARITEKRYKTIAGRPGRLTAICDLKTLPMTLKKENIAADIFLKNYK